jgi:hypothetical protein
MESFCGRCIGTSSRALCSLFLTEYHSGDEIKKTEMGKECSMCGGEERCIQGVSGETGEKERKSSE